MTNCKKCRHKTEEEAKSKALKLDRRYYYCNLCKGYHLTSEPYKGRKLKGKEKDIDRILREY